MTARVSWAVEGERPVADAELLAAAQAALEYGGRGGMEVEVILVSDAALAELHGRFLGDSSPTDVISFDLGEDGIGPAGEVYVSVDRARRVAAERGVAVARELALYLVHGILHLCGHDDRDPDRREAMRAAERHVLDSLGYPADDADPTYLRAGVSLGDSVCTWQPKKGGKFHTSAAPPGPTETAESCGYLPNDTHLRGARHAAQRHFAVAHRDEG